MSGLRWSRNKGGSCLAGKKLPPTNDRPITRTPFTALARRSLRASAARKAMKPEPNRPKARITPAIASGLSQWMPKIGPPLFVDDLLPFRQIGTQVAGHRVQARNHNLQQFLENRRINRLGGILDQLESDRPLARQIASRETLRNNQHRADFVVIDLLEGFSPFEKARLQAFLEIALIHRAPQQAAQHRVVFVHDRELDLPQSAAFRGRTEHQADQRGDAERQREIDQVRPRIVPRAPQVLDEQRPEHGYSRGIWKLDVRCSMLRLHSRSSLPVSCRNTSFRLGRFTVTFSTRTGSSSRSRRHSEGWRLFCADTTSWRSNF